MNRKTDNTNDMLLSLAVFKKLYDEGQDIYEVISSFIKCEISTRKTPFGLIEITENINAKYNFKIPQAVIKISLNKIKSKNFLKLEGGEYTIIKEITTANVKNDSELAEQQKQDVLDKIKQYLDTKNIPCESIEKSLENYILNRQDEISTHIDACVVKNSDDEKFVNSLNEIKYGLVLYEGIRYGIENINPEKWNQKVIFLDTEILFYLAGYSGKLFKQTADDFLSLIQTANRKKRIIKLRFLENTKEQIERLFYVAETIINGKKNYYPNDIVRHILELCNGGSASDILSKKTDFYNFLSKKNIKLYEDNIDYSNQINYKYNLENSNSDLDDKGLERQKQLSCVNILRGSKKFNTLDKVEYLFLTQTSETIKMSMEHKQREQGFPLALKLFDLTNQLWVKTNQGLGNGDIPATFDIRNKAKIALSTSLTKGVCKEYEKVQEKYREEHVNEDLVIDQVAELRKFDSILPDDINEENCEEIEDIIVNPESLHKYYEEKAFYKQQSQDQEGVIEQQQKQIQKLEQEKINAKKVADKKTTQRKNKTIRLLKSLIFLFIVAILYYFSDNLTTYLGKYGQIIINSATILGLVLSIFVFLGFKFDDLKKYFKRWTKHIFS